MSKKDLEGLVDKIEKLRLMLYEKIRDGDGINEEETSKISSLLDKLINEFYKAQK